MKKIIVILLLALMPLLGVGQSIILNAIDTTTLSTNTLFSGGLEWLTNIATSEVISNTYLAVRTNVTQIGESQASANVKINGNFAALTSFFTTNNGIVYTNEGPLVNGNVPIMTNSGHASGYYWGSISSSSSSQTPWLKDINGNLFDLTNVGNIGNGKFFSNVGRGILWGVLDTNLSVSAPILGGYGDFMDLADQGTAMVGGHWNMMGFGFDNASIGGWSNTITPNAFIGQGRDIIIGGQLMSIVSHQGVTEIGDSQINPWIAAQDDVLLIRETNGVAINKTNTDGYALNVNGSVNATALFVNGSPFIDGNGGFNIFTTTSSHTNITYFTNSVTVTGDQTNGDGTTVNGIYPWNPLLGSPTFTGVYSNTVNGTNFIGYNSAVNALQLSGCSSFFCLTYLPQSNNPASSLIGLFTNANWNSNARNSNVLVSYTVSFTNIYLVTNTVLVINANGPNAGWIQFPPGERIIAQSFSDTNLPSDSGFVIGGTNNGQLLGEVNTMILGDFNDVGGDKNNIVTNGTVLGGMHNNVGPALTALPLGEYLRDGTTVGGESNSVLAGWSTAIGVQCYILHDRVLMFNDGGAGILTSTVPSQVVFRTTNGLVVLSGTTNSIGMKDTNGTAEVLYIYATTNNPGGPPLPQLFIHGSGTEKVLSSRDFTRILWLQAVVSVVILGSGVLHVVWYVRRHVKKHLPPKT